MTEKVYTPYPGETSTPAQILFLANEYRFAAEMLMVNRRSREPVSRSPARLCAIHAIELYLNAFLLAHGSKPQEIRAFLHNLHVRSMRAVELGMVLRKSTIAHIGTLTEQREYLINRYGPELTSTVSQDNRLMATLNEITKKVQSSFGDSPAKWTRIDYSLLPTVEI